MRGLGGGVRGVGREGGINLFECQFLYLVCTGEGGRAYVFEFPLLPALLAFAAVPAGKFLGGEVGAQRREHTCPR